MQVIENLIFFDNYYFHQVMSLNENINMVIDIVLKRMHAHQKRKLHMKKENKKQEIYNVLFVVIQKQKV
jgi:hypothetical protein